MTHSPFSLRHWLTAVLCLGLLILMVGLSFHSMPIAAVGRTLVIGWFVAMICSGFMRFARRR